MKFNSDRARQATDAQWPWGREGHLLFGLVELEREPCPKTGKKGGITGHNQRNLYVMIFPPYTQG